jgi:multidrug efflux pump subunit AcrA (membrane-fusion protein)
MKEFESIQVHTEEVVEILGKIPPFIVRWGLLFLFLIFVGILTISHFIRSPDTVGCSVILTTQQPPARLVAKVGGIIDTMYVREGMFVNKDVAVASIVNSASLPDVTQLSAMLKGEDTTFKSAHFPSKLTLGELQNHYSAFLKALKQREFSIETRFTNDKIALVEKQRASQREIIENMRAQLSIKHEEFIFVTQNFKRDSTLYQTKRYGISLMEYENAIQKYLADKANYLAFVASVKNAEQTLVSMNQAYLELQERTQSNDLSFLLLFREAKENLIAQLAFWEERFLVKSPIDGYITFTKVWSENQIVATSEPIATVVPIENDILIKAFIPPARFGSVQVGQSVIVRLDGFPSLQYGVLHGVITKLSLVPEDAGYAADIKLSNGMTSSYHERLKFIQEMRGNAEIVIGKTTMLTKIIPALKYFGK